MSRHTHVLVLAIYPGARGFAFVVFEDPCSPVDWGVKDVRRERKNERCLTAIAEIIDRYQPGVLVLQDTSADDTRRSLRIRHLNVAIADMAKHAGIETVAFSRREVLRSFAAERVTTKRQLAQAIAGHIPAIGRYLPPIRKPWMSEDARMHLFDAAALASTFYRRSDCGGDERS